MTPTPVRRLPLAILASAALLAACATPGEPVAPAVLATPAALPTTAAAAPTDSWWQALGDARLDALVRQALAEQPSLAAAQARVRRAQALAGLTEAATGPQARLSAEVLRQRYSEHGILPAPIAGNVWNTGALSASASWSPDFFGLHAAELATAVGQVRAAEAEAAAAANGLSAQVVRSYVGLARLLEQRAVAVRTREQREALRRLTRQRVAAGLDTRVEQVQADGALPDVGTQIEALDEQVALARRQLAVLCGQAPEALDGLNPSLAALKLGERPGLLAADLLGRRPDVVAARWRVEATLQDTGAARAQFYPDINLSAFAGLNSLGLNHLFDAGSRQFGVQPALHLPLFDGGRLRANLRGKEAERDVAIAQYNGTLADAVREVGDALTSEASLQRQRAQQAQALAAAEQAWSIAVRRHEAGLGSYLVVLNAETAVLAQRRAAVDLQARALDTRVALVKALGGGWQAAPALDTTALATPAAVR